eukprot:7381411-Prymnesium_polylepis.2
MWCPADPNAVMNGAARSQPASPSSFSPSPIPPSPLPLRVPKLLPPNPPLRLRRLSCRCLARPGGDPFSGAGTHGRTQTLAPFKLASAYSSGSRDVGRRSVRTSGSCACEVRICMCAGYASVWRCDLLTVTGIGSPEDRCRPCSQSHERSNCSQRVPSPLANSTSFQATSLNGLLNVHGAVGSQSASPYAAVPVRLSQSLGASGRPGLPASPAPIHRHRASRC